MLLERFPSAASIAVLALFRALCRALLFYFIWRMQPVGYGAAKYTIQGTEPAGSPLSLPFLILRVGEVLPFCLLCSCPYIFLIYLVFHRLPHPKINRRPKRNSVFLHPRRTPPRSRYRNLHTAQAIRARTRDLCMIQYIRYKFRQVNVSHICWLAGVLHNEPRVLHRYQR